MPVEELFSRKSPFADFVESLEFHTLFVRKKVWQARDRYQHSWLNDVFSEGGPYCNCCSARWIRRFIFSWQLKITSTSWFSCASTLSWTKSIPSRFIVLQNLHPRKRFAHALFSSTILVTVIKTLFSDTKRWFWFDKSPFQSFFRLKNNLFTWFFLVLTITKV